MSFQQLDLPVYNPQNFLIIIMSITKYILILSCCLSSIFKNLVNADNWLYYKPACGQIATYNLDNFQGVQCLWREGDWYNCENEVIKSFQVGEWTSVTFYPNDYCEGTSQVFSFSQRIYSSNPIKSVRVGARRFYEEDYLKNITP